MQKTEIEIQGMTCGHCASSISKQLAAVSGVQVIEVNHQSGKAVIEGDAAEKELAEAIDRAGYQATRFVKVND